MPTRSLKDIQYFLLDMDGTLYRGNRLLGGAREFLETLRRKDKRYLFLTNNSSQSVEEYCSKLVAMGIPTRLEEVFTAALATIIHLKRHGGTRRLFLLAPPAVEREFADAGFVLTDDQPDEVVLCLDTTLTYAKLQTACRLILQGAGFVASHPDLVCPTDGVPAPDCGSIIRLISAATGVEPRIVGKPNQPMIDIVLAELGAAPDVIAIVGDRYVTDIEMGFRAGLTTILVLTGDAKRENVADFPRQPDYIVDSIADLIGQV